MNRERREHETRMATEMLLWNVARSLTGSWDATDDVIGDWWTVSHGPLVTMEEKIMPMIKQLKSATKSTLASLEHLAEMVDGLDYPESPIAQYQTKRLRDLIEEAHDMIAARVAAVTSDVEDEQC